MARLMTIVHSNALQIVGQSIDGKLIAENLGAAIQSSPTAGKPKVARQGWKEYPVTDETGTATRD